MPQLNGKNSRARPLRLSSRLVPKSGSFDELPDHLRDLLSPVDPDLHVICDSIELMRIAGFDVTTADGLRTAVEAGRRRALELAIQANSQAREHQRIRAEMDREALVDELEQRSVVYYARTGDLVKIGYTTNLTHRMSAIGPDELLVTEPGGPKREHERHQQFIELWARGEWFRYEGALRTHVAELRPLQTPDVVKSVPKKTPIPIYSDNRRLTTAEAASLAGVATATIRSWGCRTWIPVTHYPDGYDMEEILAYRNTRKVYRPKPLDWAG